MLRWMLTTRARWIVALLSLCVIPAAIPWPAAAQLPETPVTLRLIDQPLWHSPGDPLGFELGIENGSDEGLEGFLLRIEGHSRASSRSALHEAFDGNPGFSSSSFSKIYEEVQVPVGETHTVRVTEPISDLSAISTAPGGGVFPVTISLFEPGGGELIDSLTTPLIYYPTPPEVPLGFSMVVPLNDVPSRSPDGSFVVEPISASVRVEDAVQPGGWLDALLNEPDRATIPPEPEPEPRRRSRGRRGRKARPDEPPAPPALRLALAPTPRFVEELADLADGYPRGDLTRRPDSATARAADTAVKTLRTVLRRESVQPLLSPYSFPDLPGVTDRLALEDGLIPQFTHGRAVLLKELGLDLQGDWLFPPAGRLDAGTLQDLRAIDAGFGHVLLTEESFHSDPEVAPLGCPGSSPSFVCPIQIQGPGQITGLLTDDGVQNRFADLVDGIDPRLGVQNFFAETAMIREEAPGVSGRVVQATMPSLWHPEGATIRRIVRGLRSAPWLQPLTPQEALQTGLEPSPRRLVPALSRLAIQDPTEGLFDSIASTQDLVESFQLIRPPAALTQRLTRNLLVAQSRLWGASPLLTERADTYVEKTLAETEGELDKITVGGTDEIRLTSQRGEIPLEVFNEASYPVSLNVRVVSPDLRLDETFPLALQPDRFQQITVDIAARSSGIFPVEVSLETPDGSYEIDTRSITVRSTEFNQIAVVITIGALVFLVLFYLVPGLRRRAPHAEAA